MPVRRAADPVSVQNVWNAIRTANSQKQMADSNRITKYLQKALECNPGQAELYLKQTLQDELILAVQKVTAKGINAGSEVESYKIPQQEPEEIVHVGHDWYCIDCHLAGDVSLCVTCHRVFHTECGYKKQFTIKKSPPFFIKIDSLLETNKLTEPLLIVKTPEQVNASQLTSFLNDSSEISQSMDDDRSNDITLSAGDSSYLNGTHSSRTDHDDYYDEAVCSICNMSRADPELPVEQAELNYLLLFVFNRIKTWIPVDLSKTIEPDDKPPEWCTDKERKWRREKLFFEHISLPVIDKKLEAKEYRQPHEFKADMLSIQHNIAVYHGTDTQEYKASELFLKDCMYEISELSNCLDCYKHSNEKVNENWFSIPCRIPHQLVWAKQQGHPYWPAKVLKETDKSSDVRFFGGKYERALLSKTYIKPITTSMNALNIKKKPGFNKAVRELLLHQKMLKDSGGIVIKNAQDDEPKLEKVVKDRNATQKRLSTPVKTHKRSHSVDKLSVKEDIIKAAKRRNSSATLNNIVAKPRGSEYTTRQSIQNLAKKKNKRSSKAVATSTAKNISTTETHPKLEYNSKTVEESNKNDNEDNHEEVTSSSETVKMIVEPCTFPDDTKMPKPERQYSESVEKTRRKLEECIDKDDLIKVGLECMQAEIDKISNEHDIYLKRLFEAHNSQISETKKKQWCYNCEQDAIYHCCWNTAYCSLNCQQQHWQAEHKKVCRRKR